jgi:hypothetical protein
MKTKRRTRYAQVGLGGRHEMYRDAAVRLMAGLRVGTGNRELIIGNAGPLPETRMARFVNGYVFEGYSGAWDGFADSTGKPSEPAWRRARRPPQNTAGR